jgi:hypothetical protein
MRIKQKIKTLTPAQKELFFIFSEKMPQFFIHLKPGFKANDEKQEFVLKKGASGASLFNEQNATTMIKHRPGLKFIQAKNAVHLL